MKQREILEIYQRLEDWHRRVHETLLKKLRTKGSFPRRLPTT